MSCRISQKKHSKANREPTSSKPVIAFFPYLCVDKPLSFGDIDLRPSMKTETEKESELTRSALFDLAECFRLHYEGRLPCWSFVVTHVRNKEEWLSLRQKLDKLTCVLRYINLSTLREDASFSHFNYYMLEVDRRLIVSTEHKYFDCILNGIHTVGFGKHGGEVYKPYVLKHIETPFVLYAGNLKSNHLYQQFYGNSSLSEKDAKKFLRAFEWFNRSFLEVQEVDDSHAVIHLQTAVESLLKASQDGIKAQVRTALFMLLGESEELSDWIEQFWKLRNGLVHGDIDIQPFWFRHKRGTIGHKHHILFAKKVFVKCVNQLFGLRNDLWTHSLHEELISNEVRLKKASTIIKKRASSFQIEQVSSILYGLTKDDLSASKEQVLDFGESFFPRVIRRLKENGKGELAQALDKIPKTRSSEEPAIALRYNEALQKFQESLFSNRSTDDNTIVVRHDPEVSTVRTFLDFASWRLLVFYD